MAKKILISNILPADARRIIPGDIEVDYNETDRPLPKADLIRRLRDKDGLICHIISTIDDDVLAAVPGLKVVSNVAVGYNWRNPRSTRGCCRCAT
jgi:glyoxylate reductase